MVVNLVIWLFSTNKIVTDICYINQASKFSFYVKSN